MRLVVTGSMKLVPTGTVVEPIGRDTLIGAGVPVAVAVAVAVAEGAGVGDGVPDGQVTVIKPLF